METKRCAQCHKLLRAETQVCSRCGYVFSEKKRKIVTRDLSRPSLPPASPHRAGHYSGLHPEDQPYQSSMIAVQHAPARKVKEIEPVFENVAEVEEIVPEAVRERAERPTLPPRGDDAPTQVTVRHEKPQTEAHIPSVPPPAQIEVPRERPLLDTDGSLPAFYRPRQPKRVPTTKRTISLLLMLSCIFFLLASGILVYVLIGTKPTSSPRLRLTVNPATVRASDTFTLSGSGFTPSTQVKFTYDDGKPLNDSMHHPLTAIVDLHNSFSVDVITPTNWSAGAHTMYAFDNEQQASAKASLTVEAPSEASPLLQLATTSINLGTNAAGTTSSKQITLKNGGGGKLTWQSKSDATWLTIAPVGSNGYTFSGSTLASITVNRSNLAPKATYTGHIVFSQKDGSNASKLTVTMGVDSTPAALNVSPSLLTFAATNAQTVPTQSVTLQNSGGKSVSWHATATTNDGANWLYANTTSATIDAAQTQTLAIGVQAQLLAAGSYQGAVVLTTGSASATVTVSLTILAAGNILVTPTTLNFTGSTQQSVASEQLTLQNTGGQAQTWSTSVDSGNWLSLSPSNGSVNAGAQTTIGVNINTAGLTANNYQGNITFNVGNQISIVPITLTLTTPPVAAISVQQTALNFQTTLHNNPAGQPLTITNTGNAVLHWTASESGNGFSFAPLSLTSGTLEPQGSRVIQVNPSVATQPSGTLRTTITIADSDPGTPVASQQIQVTVNIQSQAEIATSPVNFSVTAGNTSPMTQTVTILNTGSAPLNWSATTHTDDGGTWLSVNTLSGTLAPGARQNIIVSCDSTGLTKKTTYQGSVTISDRDTGTTVSPATVYLSFFT